MLFATSAIDTACWQRTCHRPCVPRKRRLVGIERDEALAKLQVDHSEARPLVGRDLSEAIRALGPEPACEPVLFITDDEISEGAAHGASPFQRVARATHTFSTVEQPNHIETVIAEVDVDGEKHLVKLSRYHDNQQFWTVPGERDERLRGRKTITVTEPEPDEYELYDLTLDPHEERNLAHANHADERARALQATMLELLSDQLAAKRLIPSGGETPGYRPPVTA